MIKIINNFSNNQESNQLIDYYKSNIHSELITNNEVYSFKSVTISDYSILDISNKLKIKNPIVLRVQLINNTIKVNEYMHTHGPAWSSILFLNDDFDGGELLIENIQLKPKKNQLVLFTGNLKHMVNPVINGNRYTFVSFTNEKIIYNQII